MSKSNTTNAPNNQIALVKQWRKALRDANDGLVFNKTASGSRRKGKTIYGLPKQIQHEFKKTNDALLNTFKQLFTKDANGKAFFDAMRDLIVRQSAYAFNPLLRSQGLEKALRKLITEASKSTKEIVTTQKDEYAYTAQEETNIKIAIKRGTNRLKKHATTVRNTSLAVSAGLTGLTGLTLSLVFLSPLMAGNPTFIALVAVATAVVAAVSFGCTEGLYKRNTDRHKLLRGKGLSVFAHPTTGSDPGTTSLGTSEGY